MSKQHSSGCFINLFPVQTWFFFLILQGDNVWKVQLNECWKPGDCLRSNSYAAAGAERLDNPEWHEAAEASGAAYNRAWRCIILRSEASAHYKRREGQLFILSEEIQATLILVKSLNSLSHDSFTLSVLVLTSSCYCKFRVSTLSQDHRLDIRKGSCVSNYLQCSSLLCLIWRLSLPGVDSVIMTVLCEICSGHIVSRWRLCKLSLTDQPS